MEKKEANENTHQKKRLYYRLEEIEEMYSIPVRTLRDFIYTGKIKASKVGRRYIVAKEEIENLVSQNEFKPYKPKSHFR